MIIKNGDIFTQEGYFQKGTILVEKNKIKRLIGSVGTSMHLNHECGSIVEGKIADLVLLDRDLNIRMIIKEGNILWKE